MVDTLHFTFVIDPDQIEHGQDCCLAIVPSHLQCRQELFAVLSEELHFPNYFGDNWDALYDMLCDFHWLQSRRVIIVHYDIPLAISKQNSRIYLDILNESIDGWKPEEDHELMAVFPAKYEKTIYELLMNE